MLSGEHYLHSRQKRALDVFVATSARPANALAILVARRCMSQPGRSTLLQQDRIGMNREPFTIDKIRTLRGDNETPVNWLAEQFRKMGLDELPQIEQIRDGDMSVFGRRPFIGDEFDKFMDKVAKSEHGDRLVPMYERFVIPSKPGLLSTYGIESHTSRVISPVEHCVMDISDHLQASFSYDARMALGGFKRLLKNEWQNGRVTHEDVASPAEGFSDS
jgi:lipopolysaccharide/colanic/teichoic acid biosynthesis glycosyltransferase